MLRWAGMPAASACAPKEEFGTEIVFCDGGVVLSGGGVAPSDLIRSAELFKAIGAASSFCGAPWGFPIVCILLEGPDARLAAVAVVVADTLIARGVVVVYTIKNLSIFVLCLEI